ncbi:MAG: hypothetical protein J6O56_01915 [Bacilli bacterium]|nr:hypothetical protein [Bacilli bacterium]
MTKYIKLIFIGIILVLLTGCSGNYNLKINKDLTINEELELTLEKESETYEKTLKIFEDNNIDTSKYKIVTSGDEVQITYKENYNSIEDYIVNSKVYPQLVDKIEYNKKDGYVDLYVDENLKVKNSVTDNIGTNLLDFDVIQVNIINPFKINVTNAELQNEDTYTWSLTKDNPDLKVQMQFRPTMNRIPYRPIIVLVVIVLSSFILIYRFSKRFKGRQKI